mgnify:CR=1 FL=1
MLIGIDFDNTLVSYDEVFRSLAIDEKIIDSSWIGNKLELKNYLFLMQDGEFKWQQLQGKAYGKFMHKAEIFKGVKEFLYQCKIQKLQVCIVSHKTIFGIHDKEKIPLRKEALKWMHKQGFFNDMGLSENDIYFEHTIEDKINRINNLNCTYFIDDLLEILTHPNLSSTVNKILFNSSNNKEILPIHSFLSWNNFSTDYFHSC